MNRLTFLPLVVAMIAGCSGSSPSDGGALQTYEQEAAALAQLEAEAERVQADHEARNKQDYDADMKQRQDRSAEEDFQRLAAARREGDEAATKVQREIDERDATLLKEYMASRQPVKDQQEQELAKLREQIEAQKQRVEQARLAKEAAAHD